jgi:membrane-associated phospholipid phosphatase
MKTTGLLRHYTFVDYATQAYCALVGLLILFFHNDTVPAWRWLLAVHAGGLLLIHLLIQGQGRAPGSVVLDFLRYFYPLLLFGWFFAETGWLNRMFFPTFLDPGVIKLEQKLFGCQPAVQFMEKLPYLGISEMFYFFYFSYYIMIGGVGLALFLRDRRQFLHYVSVVSFLFYICYLLYIALPIIGPPIFFRQFHGYALPADIQRMASTTVYPEAVKTGVFFRLMAWVYRVFEAPGAALPSSHVAVALCTVYFSFRYLRPIRYLHLAAAILLCLSTIYCRYHYGLDVLAGVVTAAVVIPLGNWLYFKFEPRLEKEAEPKSFPRMPSTAK